MAFMAMKKNLNERARRKAFNDIFYKFDHNKNGKYEKPISILHAVMLCRQYVRGGFHQGNQ